jgi:hypothetical protein
MTDFDSGYPSPSIPVSWTDDPLVSRETRIKKVHLTEMRAALEAMDGHIHTFNGNDSGAELPDVSVSWNTPDVDIIIGQTQPYSNHINEVIGFIKDFEGHYHNVPYYVPYGGGDSTTYDPGFTFEDDPVVSHVTYIKASAWEELRSHLESYSTHIHTVCCECECQCTCTCTCTCTCQCQCTCQCTCDAEI